MSALFALQTNQIMLLAGIGLVLLVFVNRLRRSFVIQERPRAYRAAPFRPKPTSSNDALRGASPRSSTAGKQHEAWEVEMHELARRLKAEIDTKMAALAALVQTADAARMQLEVAIDRAESLGLLDENSVSGRAQTEDEPQCQITGFSSARREPPVRTTAASNSGHAARRDALASDSRFDRVYALADAGFSSAKIASQVGSQVGEVELILSLRRAG